MEVKSEYKMTELGKIPVEWEVKNIVDVFENYGGTSIEKEFVEHGNYKVISIGSYGLNSVYNDQGLRVSGEGKAKDKILNKNDLVMVLNDKTIAGNIIGRTLLIEEDNKYVYNQRSERLVPKFGSSKFYWYLLNSDLFRKQVIKTSQGGTQIYINFPQIKMMKVILPPLKEQQKIAEILSTVDEQIEQIDQLIEKTKELKKGLMQQLLTKGIDHKEFKQSELGEIPVNWIVEKLEKTVHILDGKRRPIKKNDRISGDIPYYGATGIIDWVNNYLFNETLILVGEDGENLNSRVLPMAFKITGKTWINNHAHVLKPIENISIDYLTYFLESVNYSIYITGSAQPKLNQEQLRKILILIPPFLEQQKIADILSSIDEEMEGYKQEKCQYEELKKGLMQQLLTGKTRVKVD